MQLYNKRNLIDEEFRDVDMIRDNHNTCNFDNVNAKKYR